MTIEVLIQQVQKAIAEAETVTALDLLLQFARENNNTNLEEKTLQISARYHRLQDDRPILSTEDIELQSNRIDADMLNLIKGLHSQQQLHNDDPNKPKMGKLLHNIPKQMTLQKESKCIVRIAYDELTVMRDMKPSSDIEITSIRIAEVMGVELLDPSDPPNFKIRVLSKESDQYIVSDDFTQWVFYIKPLTIGIQPLVLSVAVIEMIDGIERKRDIILEKEIDILSTDTAQPKLKDLKQEGQALLTAFPAGTGAASPPEQAAASAAPPSPMIQKSETRTSSAAQSLPQSSVPQKSGSLLNKMLIGGGALAAVLIGVFFMLPTMSSPTLNTSGDNGMASIEKDDNIPVSADTTSSQNDNLPEPQFEVHAIKNAPPAELANNDAVPLLHDDEAAMSPPKVRTKPSPVRKPTERPVATVEDPLANVAVKTDVNKLPPAVYVLDSISGKWQEVQMSNDLPQGPSRAPKGYVEVVLTLGNRVGDYQLIVNGETLQPFDSQVKKRFYKVKANDGKPSKFEIIANGERCSIETVPTEMLIIKACDVK